jgi:putative transposase
MVPAPGQYSWSSHLANAHGHDDPRLSQHPILASLADTREARQQCYRALFDEVLDETQVQDIRTYLQQQRAWGSARFQAVIEAQLGRCATVWPAHRPIVRKAL